MDIVTVRNKAKHNEDIKYAYLNVRNIIEEINHRVENVINNKFFYYVECTLHRFVMVIRKQHVWYIVYYYKTITTRIEYK